MSMALCHVLRITNMWSHEASAIAKSSNCHLDFSMKIISKLQDTSRNNGGNTPCTVFIHSNLIIQQPFSFYGINFAGDINCYWTVPLELYIDEALRGAKYSISVGIYHWGGSSFRVQERKNGPIPSEFCSNPIFIINILFTF